MKYNICVPIVEKTTSEALQAIKKARKAKADLIELRLDFLQDLNEKNLRKLLQARKKPIIVTCRTANQGGKFSGNENFRLEIFKKALELKADFIDLELNSAGEMLRILKEKNKKTQFILSYHNFQETPDNFELEMLLRKINAFEPDIIKIFTKANKLSDIIRIFETVKQQLKFGKKIVFGLIGETGEASRILASFFGSEWTYASLEKGKESAEGQISIQELLEVYKVKRFKERPLIRTTIGNPITHSKSPLIHNTILENAKINTIMLKLKVEDLNDWKQFFDYFEISGSAVTMPWKEGVIKFMDKLDKAVQEIGAMNTIVRENGKLIGYNTDMIGAINALNFSLEKKSLQKKFLLKGKKVALFGAGGAAKAIAFGLKQENSEVTIINRDLEKAKTIALKFEQNFASLNSLKELGEFEIIVNATPVGMAPKINESIVPEKFLKKGTIVMDCVTTPVETKLLKTAKSKGCKTIPGVEMLIGQAIEQFKLFHKKKPNENLMKKAFKKVF